MYYSTGSGRIELDIDMDVADSCSHPGPCDADVAEALEYPEIKAQFDKIDPAILAEELKEWGAWDTEELKDHEENKARLLWIACSSIMEELYERENSED